MDPSIHHPSILVQRVPWSMDQQGTEKSSIETPSRDSVSNLPIWRISFFSCPTTTRLFTAENPSYDCRGVVRCSHRAVENRRHGGRECGT